MSGINKELDKDAIIVELCTKVLYWEQRCSDMEHRQPKYKSPQDLFLKTVKDVEIKKQREFKNEYVKENHPLTEDMATKKEIHIDISNQVCSHPIEGLVGREMIFAKHEINGKVIHIKSQCSLCAEEVLKEYE